MEPASREEEKERQRAMFMEAFARFVEQGQDETTAAANALTLVRNGANGGIPHANVREQDSVEATTDVASMNGKEEYDGGVTDGTEKEASVPPPAPGKCQENRAANITVESLERDLVECRKNGAFSPVIRQIGSIFSSPEKIVENFALEDGSANLELVRGIFGLIDSEETAANALSNALNLLVSQVAVVPSYPYENILVPFLVCLEYAPFSFDPDLNSSVSSIFRAVSNLPSEGKSVLKDIWSRMSPDYLSKVLELTQMFISMKVMLHKQLTSFAYVIEGVVILEILHSINQTNNFTKYDEFYNGGINEVAAERDRFLIEEFIKYREALEEGRRTHSPPSKESFCDYFFVLDAASKTRLLQIEARYEQQTHYRMNMQPFDIFTRPMPYFVMRVRREEIVNDVLDIVSRAPPSEFKKQLRVQFEGEEGVDEGGVKKEFFLLLVRKLLDPQYGMFQMEEETRSLWFCAMSFEMAIRFELCGILIGLAIYNGVILDVHFPLALYYLLLGKTPTLRELVDYSPRLGKSLEQLLVMDDESVDSLSLSFQIARESFGHVEMVDLKPGGAEIPVTGQNKQEYVDLYVDFVFNKSISHGFAPFERGFKRVCDNTFLKLFEPEEMELLLCGSPNLDFMALEKSCRYEDGFTINSPTITNFWSVLHEMEESQKKKFLMFATGSDRVPIRGLSALRLTISRNGEDSDRLPVAHTCFNHLLLPEYSSREKLRERLLLAIEHSEGFGTM